MPYHKLRDVTAPHDESIAMVGEHDLVMVPWSSGLPYDRPVPQPLHVQLDPDAGTILPDLFLLGLPMASPKFLAVLTNLGVDNLGLYDTVLTDPNGTTHTHYKAFNIVGAIACADLERSLYTEIRDGELRFKKLVVDEARTHGLPLFRLAEDTMHILVSDELKAALVAANLVGVHFEPLG